MDDGRRIELSLIGLDAHHSRMGSKGFRNKHGGVWLSGQWSQKVLEAAGESMMHTETHHPEAKEYLFGPFRFVPASRTLLCGDIPQRLGGRAIDILAILLERPNELVGKRELIARVWPSTVVEDGNLKVHVSALRRTLGEFQQGLHYISTINGRGYCFVAPVNATTIDKAGMVPDNESAADAHALQAIDNLCLHTVGTAIGKGLDPPLKQDPDATQTTIEHVREQIGSLQYAVEVLESERDRDRKELQSLRAQLEAAIGHPSAHRAPADHVHRPPGGNAPAILILPAHVQDSCTAD